MNQRDDLDRMLSPWLDDPLTLPAPGYLGEVLDHTRQVRQRPSWASLERWLPMSIALRRSTVPMPALLAMLGLLVLLAIVASLSIVPLLAGALGPTGVDAPAGRIAFDRDGDIWVTEPEPGADPRAIVSGPTEDVGPYWSPDGRHLLFFRVTPEGETPMLTDADGSEPIPLVDAPLGGVGWVDWTSDSSGLVLSVDPRMVDAFQPSGLVMLPADGSGELRSISQNVARAPATRAIPRPGSSASIDLIYRLAADPSELWYLGPDGAGQVLRVEDIAGVRTAGYGGEFDFMHPAWSPRGDRFAYDTLNDVVGAPDGNGLRVHVAHFEPDHPTGPAGQDDVIVEFDPMSDDEGWPVWSPDGSRVAFQAFDDHEARLVIMQVPADGLVDATSAVATRAVSAIDPGSLSYTWSPDGETVLLVDGDAVGDPAYLVDASTGALTPFVSGVSPWPSWQPRATH